MKKDKVVKIMMSAAVMVSVAAVPARAEEERSAETDMVQAIDTEEDSQVAEVGEEPSGMEAKCVMEKGQEEQPEQGVEPEAEAEQGEEAEAREAVYQSHSSFSGGPGVVKWQSPVKEPVKEPVQEYGPHCVSLIQEEKAEEQDMQQEPEETAPSYTEEDLYILAHAICGEGQCYPDDEQLYIGSVILNRKNHSAYPDTIKGVVFQKGQYACTWDGNYYREPTEANWRNARWLLENGSILPGNVVYQAGFRQGNGLYLQTRYHKYCYRS